MIPQCAQCLAMACSADPDVDLLVEGTINESNTAEVFKLLHYLQCYSLNGNVGATGCRYWRGLEQDLCLA